MSEIQPGSGIEFIQCTPVSEAAGLRKRRRCAAVDVASRALAIYIMGVGNAEREVSGGAREPNTVTPLFVWEFVVQPLSSIVSHVSCMFQGIHRPELIPGH
jgi:hypothetical protein